VTMHASRGQTAMAAGPLGFRRRRGICRGREEERMCEILRRLEADTNTRQLNSMAATQRPDSVTVRTPDPSDYVWYYTRSAGNSAFVPTFTQRPPLRRGTHMLIRDKSRLPSGHAQRNRNSKIRMDLSLISSLWIVQTLNREQEQEIIAPQTILIRSASDIITR